MGSDFLKCQLFELDIFIMCLTIDAIDHLDFHIKAP